MEQEISKLVAVCASRRRRDSKYKFERRQIPLDIDDGLTMVVEFADTCVGCEQVGAKQKERERFVKKFSALSKDDVAIALIVTKKEVFNLMSQIVPCVGCRKSVERLFCQLVESGHPALEPLIITKKSELSVNVNFLFDPRAIFALFHVHGSKLHTVMDGIPKSRKNKRCALHSLDTHKVRGLGIWKDVWDKLSHDCREEVVLIDSTSLMETLETYLRKHRFCSDCKSKVLRAYNILIGDVDYNTEKGYCPSLYEGLKCCPQEKHLHVLCDTEFIEQLICRAEPELNGSRRERHAKTLDIAQEEVLTCLGIHLYERLHKIWQKLRAEEQTWQILFYLSVEALKKSFEVAIERKQGITNLELMCEELLEEERVKKQKMEQKRQKKKKKNKNKNGDKDLDADKVDSVDSCQCDNGSDTPSSPSRSNHSPTSTGSSSNDASSTTNSINTSSSSSINNNNNSSHLFCAKCNATQCHDDHNANHRSSSSSNNNSHHASPPRTPPHEASPPPTPPHHRHLTMEHMDHYHHHHRHSPSRSPPLPPLTPLSLHHHEEDDDQDQETASALHQCQHDQQQAAHFSSSLSCSECTAVNGTIDRPLWRCMTSSKSDGGYSSGLDGCESCSMPSSNGSDIVCSEEGCNHDHDGESSLCGVALSEVVEMCKACQSLGDSCADCSRKKGTREKMNKFVVDCAGSESPPCGPDLQTSSHGDQSYISLADMLEASGSSEDENGEVAISEEEMKRFRDNRKLMDSQRQQLRQTLRKRFDMLCRNGRNCTGVACSCAQKYGRDPSP